MTECLKRAAPPAGLTGQRAVLDGSAALKTLGEHHLLQRQNKTVEPFETVFCFLAGKLDSVHRVSNPRLQSCIVP